MMFFEYTGGGYTVYEMITQTWLTFMVSLIVFMPLAQYLEDFKRASTDIA
ncbi:hypothetical protein [Flocculibacter collagenilyticus]|nr:hypothetical protein [Flocculibacter collagenilyticus]